MKAARAFVIPVLALATFLSGIIACQQRAVATRLRASSFGPETEAAWHARLAELESRNRVLEDQRDALETSRECDASIDNETASRARNRSAQGERRALDSRYAALFKSLALPADRLDRLKDLLVRRGAARREIANAASAGKLETRLAAHGANEQLAREERDFEAAIGALLGDEGLAAVLHYDATEAKRRIVQQLQQSLSYTREPLDDAEAAQLLAVLARHAPPLTIAAFTHRAAAITAEALAAARTVLTAGQLQVLDELRQLQRAKPVGIPLDGE